MKQFVETLLYFLINRHVETETKLFNQTEPEVDKLEIVEQSMQVSDMSFL